MTKNISEEELLLRKRARRRLVGAIVVVIIAVIILPMIFDEPKPESEKYDVAINYPTEDTISEVPPLLLPSEESSTKGAYVDLDQTELISPEYLESSEIDQLFEDDVVLKKHVPIPGIKPQYAAINIVIEDNPEDAIEEFVVQLGAFSNLSKAEQQQRDLLSSGIITFTETIEVDNSQVTRVRIGPFSTRETAEDELKELKRLGLDGVVTSK